MLDQTKGRYRFIGVSPVPVTDEFMNERRLDFDVVTGIDAEVTTQYRFSGTPQTLLISNERRVLQTWAGAYSGVQKQEIESYFGLQLPGLSAARQSRP
jgi:hypothetical protein